jgi:hypothetical protein
MLAPCQEADLLINPRIRQEHPKRIVQRDGSDLSEGAGGAALGRTTFLID